MGEGTAGDGGAPASVRMVSSPAQLAALLRSHVQSPEATESLAAAPPAPEPDVTLPGPARDGSASEELLLDKLLDRFQQRLREESIRRFGLSGGDL